MLSLTELPTNKTNKKKNLGLKSLKVQIIPFGYCFIIMRYIELYDT